jgi:alpha-tubulin suppressor-like RCC1 family protein
VKAISAGGAHNLALKQDGSVVAWGVNSVGQTTVPDGLIGVKAISAGSGHNLALRDDARSSRGDGTSTARPTSRRAPSRA